jgi:hypothetical protein
LPQYVFDIDHGSDHLDIIEMGRWKPRFKFEAAEPANYLERVVSAIGERRLFGFTLQEQAESAASSGRLE